MINKIANLSAQLRQEGLPVSIRSTQAAVQVHQTFGEDDRELLKSALMAVYVKDKYDIPKFNKIFEKIFKVQVEKMENPELNKGKAYSGTINILLKSKTTFSRKSIRKE